MKIIKKICFKWISVLVLLSVIHVIQNPESKACTGFYMKTSHKALFGNNEDGSNPETRIWTVPGTDGTFGRIYFGYNDLSSQGGVNEKGLWFDAFGLPFKYVKSNQKKFYPGDLQDKIMAECATVAEVIQMLDVYNRSGMTRYQWMFGDRYGNSVIIEGDTIISKQGNYQIVTNFRQSEYPSGLGYECNRYQIASDLLKTQSNADINAFRNILSATHSEGDDATLYSYIADLSEGLIYVYYFHNFENPVILDIKAELSKGAHIYNIPELFPRNNAARSFEYRKKSELIKLKESRRYTSFNADTYHKYIGHYVILNPDVLSNQVIDISRGPACLHLRLNNGGPYEVIPVSEEEFVLIGYGGLELSCKFRLNESLPELLMEGSGLSIRAIRGNQGESRK